jgi:type IV secretory pathway TrbD component
MRRSTCAQFQDNNSSLRSRRVSFCPSCPSSSSSSTAESSLLLSASPASVSFPCCFLFVHPLKCFLDLSLSVSVSRICSQKIIMFEALRPVVVVISLLSFSFSFSFLVWLFSGFSAFFSVALSFFLIFGHLLLFCFAFLFCRVCHHRAESSRS